MSIFDVFFLTKFCCVLNFVGFKLVVKIVSCITSQLGSEDLFESQTHKRGEKA